MERFTISSARLGGSQEIRGAHDVAKVWELWGKEGVIVTGADGREVHTNTLESWLYIPREEPYTPNLVLLPPPKDPANITINTLHVLDTVVIELMQPTKEQIDAYLRTNDKSSSG
jgi:hypothetical protein